MTSLHGVQGIVHADKPGLKPEIQRGLEHEGNPGSGIYWKSSYMRINRHLCGLEVQTEKVRARAGRGGVYDSKPGRVGNRERGARTVFARLSVL